MIKSCDMNAKTSPCPTIPSRWQLYRKKDEKILLLRNLDFCLELQFYIEKEKKIEKEKEQR